MIFWFCVFVGWLCFTWMESGSIDIVPSSDVMDEDEIHHHHHQFPSISKPHNNNNSPGTTSVHELLECPVCTNSMYPPIHQVCFFLHFAWWVLPFSFFVYFNISLCWSWSICFQLLGTFYLLFYLFILFLSLLVNIFIIIVIIIIMMMMIFFWLIGLVKIMDFCVIIALHWECWGSTKSRMHYPIEEIFGRI